MRLTKIESRANEIERYIEDNERDRDRNIEIDR